MRFKRDMFWSTFLNITVVNDAQILRYRCMYNRSVCGLGLGGVLFFGGFFFLYCLKQKIHLRLQKAEIQLLQVKV